MDVISDRRRLGHTHGKKPAMVNIICNCTAVTHAENFNADIGVTKQFRQELG